MDVITLHVTCSIISAVLIVLFFIFVNFNDIADHKSTSLFKQIIVYLAILLLVNGLQFLIRDNISLLSYIFEASNHLLTFLILISVAMVFQGTKFIKKAFTWIPIILLFVAEIANGFNHFLYEITPDGVTNNALGNIYIILFALYAMNFGIVAFQKRNQSSAQEMTIIFANLVIMVVSALLCRINNAYILQAPLLAICILFYYFYVVSDQYKFDALTGVKTRIGFYNDYDKHIKKEFIVAMFDLDGLKSINDQYGHYVGDIVLKDMCRIVCESVSPKTEVYRWGGDEFLLFKLSNDMDEETDNLDAIRKKLAESKIYVSYGMMLHKPGIPADDFIKEIDTKLYEMKDKHKIN